MPQNKVEIRLDPHPEIYIGSSGLVFAGVDGGIDWGDDGRTVKAKATTKISVPKGRDVLALRVTLTFGLPLTADSEFHIDGDLVVGRGPLLVPIGHVEGEVTREYVEARLDIPDPDTPLPIENLPGTHLKFRMDSTGVTAEGTYKLFSIIDIQAMLIANFDGSARLTGEARVPNLGFTWDTAVNLMVDKGFTNFRVEIETGVSLNLVDFVDFEAEWARVKVTITEGADPPAWVEANALGMSVGFGLASLDADVVEEVRKWFKE